MTTHHSNIDVKIIAMLDIDTSTLGSKTKEIMKLWSIPRLKG